MVTGCVWGAKGFLFKSDMIKCIGILIGMIKLKEIQATEQTDK